MARRAKPKRRGPGRPRVGQGETEVLKVHLAATDRAQLERIVEREQQPGLAAAVRWLIRRDQER